MNLKTHKDGTQPAEDEIFVFGSNLKGLHGAGAARAAVLKYGAVMGEYWGFTGNSFAIPTKGFNIETLSLDLIEGYVDHFNECAKANPHIEFFLTRVGCGLAGYTDEQIAPMFKKLPNVNYPEEWVTLLSD